MRFESSFELDGDLIAVPATVVGPRGGYRGIFILDTGATLTTISPDIAEYVGYTEAAKLAPSKVATAAGIERGYIVRAASVIALDIRLPNVNLNVAELHHGDDGLLGMSFLGYLDFEIRMGSGRIVALRRHA